MSTRPLKKYRIRDPAQTRAKLLQATVELLSKKGPDAVSLKEAAQVAKVSRAVAYQHFRDRRHLLRESKAWITERLSELMKLVSAGSMEERTYQAATLILNNAEVAQLLLVEALNGRSFDMGHPFYRALQSAMSEFKASKLSRKEIDVEALCFIMCGGISTILLMGRHMKGADKDEVARRFTREWVLILKKGMFAERMPAGPKKKASRARKASP